MYFLFPPLFGRCQLVSYSMCCTAAAKARAGRFQLVRAHDFFPQHHNQTNTQAIGGSRCQMYHVVVPGADLSLLDRGLLHRFSFFSFPSPKPTLSDLFVPWLTRRLARMVRQSTAVLCWGWGSGRLSLQEDSLSFSRPLQSKVFACPRLLLSKVEHHVQYWSLQNDVH